MVVVDLAVPGKSGTLLEQYTGERRKQGRKHRAALKVATSRSTRRESRVFGQFLFWQPKVFLQLAQSSCRSVKPGVEGQQPCAES
jgi:hypothetical protein